MGDWNPNTPTRIGSETRIGRARGLTLDNQLQAYAGRIKLASATTISALHVYLDALGPNPGLALEVVSTLFPVVRKPATRFYPGTTTGATTTGWEDSANTATAAAVLAAVDDASTGTYARNVSARSATQSLDLLFRGATAQQVAAGTRVASVRLNVLVYMRGGVTGNPASTLVSGVLDLGGVKYVHPRPFEARRGAGFKLATFDWPLNPSTGLPWTRTSFNQLLDGATDEYGIRQSGRLAAEGFGIGGYWLEPILAVENRLGSSYSTDSPDPEWVQVDLTTTTAPAIGSWVWWILYALNGATDNALRTGLVEAPGVTPATVTSSTTGEHRAGAIVNLSNAGGVATNVAQALGASYVPILIDQSGIAAQSQPYVAVDDQTVADRIGGVRLPGTSTNRISTPDAARLDIVGDIEVWCTIALDDQTPTAASCLIGKWGAAGQRSWYLAQNTTGNLVWHWSNDGTTDNTATSSVTVGSLGAVDGYAFATVRVKFDVDNGAAGRTATFEYSFDRVNWTALGAAQTTATATSIFNSTAELAVGATNAGTADLLTGVAARWKVIAGLEGTDVRADVSLVGDSLDPGHPESLAASVSDTTITDQQGNVWTLNGSLTFARLMVGQQVTTAAATAYERVHLPVGWADPGQRPDAPLVVQVFTTWTTAILGTSPLATARLAPDALTSGTVQDVAVDLTAAWTNTLNTQYAVVVSCAGVHGWRVPVADTHSERLVSATTTLTEIEATTVGGQTDSYVTPYGVPWDRKDLHVAYETAPDSPSAGSATVRAAL